MRYLLRKQAGSGLLLLGTFFCSMAPAWPVQATPEATLAAPATAISDFEARLLLARLLAAGDGRLFEAEAEYLFLLTETPADVTILQELAALLVRTGRPREAKQVLDAALTQTPEDEKLGLALARVEVDLGQVQQARERASKICRSDDAPSLALPCAGLLISWGDFYEAETLCRNHLADHPDDPEGRLLLADILTGSQRFIEASALLQQMILDFPEMVEPYARLAAVKTLDKDFAAALAVIENAPPAIATQPILLLAAGQACLEARNYEKALHWYAQAADHTVVRPQALLGLARTHRDAGRETEGQRLLAAWPAHRPDVIEARYLTAGLEQVTRPDFPASPLVTDGATPESLVRWARLLAADGLIVNAISCYDSALAQDRNFFAARQERAILLAVAKRYDESINELADLVADFPTNPKVLMSQARVLAWSRHYDKAITAYEKLSVLNPADPTVRIEQARVAAWDKQMGEADRIYGRLWADPVDQQLLTAVDGLAPAEWLAEIRQRSDSGSPWDGYEWFNSQLSAHAESVADRTELERVRLALLADYRIQKGAFLENQAKNQVWNRHLTRALDSYEDLLAFQTGNQEGRFDYAQTQCALGLCDGAGKSYQDLLAISPSHNLALLALERQQHQASPSLALHSNYWNEQGRGEVADMNRQQHELFFTLPIFCRTQLQLTARDWLENPGGSGPDFDSNSLGLRFSGTANQYLRGSIAVNKKHYQQSDLGDLDSGSGELWFNFRDFLNLGMGLERRDELANRFAIAQGIQADHWWLGLEAPLSHRLEVTARAERLDYNDDNQGSLATLAIGYALSDHPRRFKVSVVGEARDTRDMNLTISKNSTTVDIIHPYWTPQSYTAEQLVLEWFHDLSVNQFCGAELHTYSIKLALGTDSEDNPAVRVEAEYFYEFAQHWRLQLRGQIHSSREWDSQGLWGGIGYRF